VAICEALVGALRHALGKVVGRILPFRLLPDIRVVGTK
jgi:hypothetical protein